MMGISLTRENVETAPRSGQIVDSVWWLNRPGEGTLARQSLV